jgi:hypothetical protein
MRNVARLVAVMGRRPGHLFHPAEGRGNGILFGHGPVFRDFNFDKDRAAASEIVAMNLPITLIPYEGARSVRLAAADLAKLETAGGAAAWVAQHAPPKFMSPLWIEKSEIFRPLYVESRSKVGASSDTTMLGSPSVFVIYAASPNKQEENRWRITLRRSRMTRLTVRSCSRLCQS